MRIIDYDETVIEERQNCTASPLLAVHFCYDIYTGKNPTQRAAVVPVTVVPVRVHRLIAFTLYRHNFFFF